MKSGAAIVPSPHFFSGERVRVRGRNSRCSKLLPLTPSLSPQAGRGGIEEIAR